MSRIAKKTPHVSGMLTTLDGQVFNPFESGTRELPTKQSAQHRWVATIAYFLSQEQAEAAVIPGNKVHLDMSNILAYGMGCYDCEEVYQKAVGHPCPAGDTWERS